MSATAVPEVGGVWDSPADTRSHAARRVRPAVKPQSFWDKLAHMRRFEVSRLLDTGTVAVRDVHCRGNCRHRSAEECASGTHFVFPYRGVYLRHVGSDQAVADANHVLLFNRGEAYQVSHPIAGDDSSLDVSLSDEWVRELAPQSLLNRGDTLALRHQHMRIDSRAQVLAATLRNALRNDRLEPLEAESRVLELAARSLGPRTAHEPRATAARRKLVDRVKVLLSSDLSRRWSLAEIAARIGGSAVYLTQIFQQAEGLPLYRYHLRLRLASALDRLTADDALDDLTDLALSLGFSSHSHFSAAFRQTYGRSPSAFQRAARSSR
jgi:AraC-like DNA-binding protein